MLFVASSLQVRFAMIEQLKSPPEEFKEAVHLHFRWRRRALLEQAAESTSQLVTRHSQLVSHS